MREATDREEAIEEGLAWLMYSLHEYAFVASQRERSRIFKLLQQYDSTNPRNVCVFDPLITKKQQKNFVAA